MTYGVYNKDLKGVSVSNIDLETAKRYCYQDHVVCSEKYRTIGFALHIRISKFWEFRLRPRLQYLNLGFVHISWETIRQLRADKIVWRREKEGGTK